MKIEAWMCEHCSSISKDEQDYKKCRSKCLKKKKAVADNRKKATLFDKVSNSLRLSLTDIHSLPDELEAFFKKNYDRELHISKFSITFSSNVCNSHRCPLDGKTNWGGQVKDAPRGYPGWSGHIEGTTEIYNRPIKHPVSGEKINSVFDIFGDGYRSLVKGVNSGSGGGGDKFSFSTELFLDDFPKMKARYQEFITLKNSYDTFVNVQRKLVEAATANLIEADEKLKGFKSHEKVLKALSANNQKLQIGRRDQILKSKEYKTIIQVPSKYDYDEKEYHRLVDQFRGRG